MLQFIDKIHTKLAVATFIAFFAGGGCSRHSAVIGPSGGTVAAAVPVKVVRPKSDPRLTVSVQQPAYVQGYYQADLLARAAGPVKYLVRDIGDAVKQGELLLEIDVPDRVQDVALKAAMVQQAEADLGVAEENVRALEAGVQTAESNIHVEKGTLISAEANAIFRESELNRYKVLSERKAITPDVVDEQSNNYQAAVAALASARASVNRATSAHTEARARHAMARADVILKRVNVMVAKKNLDYAQAQLDQAKVYAPFDGIVVRRSIDPGSFVKDATSSGGQPFMTLMRTDIVTIYTKLPDNYSPLVNDETVAAVTMDELPGKVIQCKVTRYASLIDGKDRTMRVEVDLYNGTRADYDRYVARGLATYFTAFAMPAPLETALSASAARSVWSANLKGRPELVPPYPTVSGEQPANQSRRLLPGMYGSMRLMLSQFQGSYLLPSGAVFSKGGKLYIARVKDGKVQMLPVRVQIDDGMLTKLQVIVREADPIRGESEQTRELAGDEEIVRGNQGELTEGQSVNATLVNW